MLSADNVVKPLQRRERLLEGTQLRKERSRESDCPSPDAKEERLDADWFIID
jgi:hypothetical protein